MMLAIFYNYFDFYSLEWYNNYYVNRCNILFYNLKHYHFIK